MNKDQKSLKLFLTDLQLHSIIPCNPQSFSRKIEKSLKSGKKNRCHGGKINILPDGTMQFELQLPENFKGKDLEIVVPQDGIPIYLGNDALEKINSLKNKK